LLILGLAEYKGGIVALGGFTLAGNTPANFVGHLHDGSWQPLGDGVNHWGHAAISYGGDLVVGGRFTEAGGSSAQHIARWDGTFWHPLGAGLDNTVYAVVSFRDTIVAGGLFLGSDGTALNCVAKWDGTRWLPLGLGMNDAVRALAIYEDRLIAGGYFTSADGNPASHIASWDGAAWSPLGEGVDATVNALAVVGNDLLVAGAFSSAGGAPARRVARWDGSTWRAIGQGVRIEVLALAALHGRLYAGSYRTADGGGLSSWDGRDWASLCLPGDVNALAPHNESIFAGGVFSRAGQTVSHGIARWDPKIVPVVVSAFEASWLLGTVRVTWLVSDSPAEAARITIRRADTPTGSYSTIATLSAMPGAMYYEDVSAARGNEYWYTLLLETHDGVQSLVGPIRFADEWGIDDITLEPPYDRAPGQPGAFRYSVSGNDVPVTLTIFDVSGRLVGVVDFTHRDTGSYEVLWDRRSQRGHHAARGVYFVQLRSPTKTLVGKLALVH
jgi:hypothetical protein